MNATEPPPPPTGIPTPEMVRRIQKIKARARTPQSLRRTVLVKNTFQAEKLKKLARRRLLLAVSPPIAYNGLVHGSFRHFCEMVNANKPTYRRMEEIEEAKQATYRSRHERMEANKKMFIGHYDTEEGKKELEAQKAQKVTASSSPTIPPSNTFTGTNDILLDSAARKKTEDRKNKRAVRKANTVKMTDLVLEHVKGNVIALATDDSVIVHACNCIGAWGSGIALQLKSTFPAAYAIYAAHCKAKTPAELLGTCLLIPPQLDDYDNDDDAAAAAKPVWIACLFTSAGYGVGSKRTGNPGRSSKSEIVKATGPALMGFLREWMDARERAEVAEEGADAMAVAAAKKGKEGEGEGDGVQESEETSPDSAIFCPKFNAGSFRVEWKVTEWLIKQKWKVVTAKWTVVSP